MPLTKMPNGEYVDIAGDTPPEVVLKIKSQFRTGKPVAAAAPRAASAAAPAPPTADQKKIAAQVADLRKNTSGEGVLSDIGRGFDEGIHSFSLHGDDVLDSAVHGIGGLASGEGFGKAYANRKEALRQYHEGAEEQSPWSTGIGGVLGAVANPIGAELGVGKVALKYAPGAVKLASAIPGAKVAARLAGSTLGRAARTGANQAALTAAADSDGDLPATANQALVGGGAGLALGGLAHGAGILRKAIVDRAPEAAGRQAYSKIASLLDNSINPKTNKAFTPEEATREMKLAVSRGHDPMLAELSPGMSSSAAVLARSPNIPNASRLVARGEQVIGGQGDRFAKEVGRRVSSQTGDDAYTLKQLIEKDRKITGAADYAPGGALDKQVPFTPELQKFSEDHAEDLQRLMPKAIQTAKRFGDDIVSSMHKLPNGQIHYVPTMRAFDYLKREIDQEIGTALNSNRSTGNTVAAGLSNVSRKLKAIIGNANPDYANVLARQRDPFQQIESVQLGQSLFKGMRTREGAKKLLAQFQAAGTKPEQLRTGIADALLDLHAQKANPALMMESLMRTPEQRALLEHAFGGKEGLKKFSTFIGRERRSATAANKLAQGRNSITGDLNLAGQGMHEDDLGDIASGALRGATFWGPVGAVSGITQKVEALRQKGLSRYAQNEVAKILMGQGQGLKEGVEAANKFKIARTLGERKRANAAARVGAYLLPNASRE